MLVNHLPSKSMSYVVHHVVVLSLFINLDISFMGSIVTHHLGDTVGWVSHFYTLVL